MNEAWRRSLIATLLIGSAMVAGCGGGGSSANSGSNGNGGSGGNGSDSCNGYTPAVAITSVTPNSGPVAGGTVVTITGSGFSKCSPSVPTVNFGGQGNGTVQSYTDTQIVVTSPRSSTAEVADILVTVVNPNGNGQGFPTHGHNAFTTSDQFTYQ